ncbi:sulfite exporter TauE/SafE family protein [Candidatus Deianiraea vastatrix]|uniref:Probable membrane transporter protein n=1 Tax=Candidatus Deianiraea vastatrix TaxID=2163644 RepID=A0A5B8XDF7_9RICK|nr:sulfite exporter TauE/SafE family protein [Candidatus Deianiraea vastatrix]QED23352.1 Putative anion permease [Candidatus Deianiraea vastatrix]
MIISWILFLIIGVSFGLIGAGGSILSVPVLIYILGLNTQLAMSYSFYIVGFTACFGFLSYRKQGLINFKDAIVFAIPSIIGVSISRCLIISSIPSEIFTIKKDIFLIVLFAILMISSAISMLLKKDLKPTNQSKSNIKTIISGFFVGLIVGILGAGGGFLIIPALYNFLKIDIKKSIGTSLFIITLNCLIAIFADLIQGKYIQFSILMPILISSICGTILGVKFCTKIDSKKIKFIFSILTIIVAMFMLFKELIKI